MTKNILKRFSSEDKERVVLAIINGELFIEEAMEKYNIQQRKTVISWLRAYLIKKKKEHMSPSLNQLSS